MDSAVGRQLAGKKLESRLAKDLEVLAEKTSVQLDSFRRQFDNIRRIYKFVKDRAVPGWKTSMRIVSLTDLIQHVYFLNNQLAKFCVDNSSLPLFITRPHHHTHQLGIGVMLVLCS